MNKEKLKLMIIFYPQETGGYTAICPEIGQATQGDTLEQTQECMKELIEDYFKHDKVMDPEDYILGYNTGNKIITEFDYEFAGTD